MRAIHRVKIHPEQFASVARGAKRHEVRAMERDYQTGDGIVLEEWDPRAPLPRFTGRCWYGVIGHVTLPGSFGLPGPLTPGEADNLLESAFGRAMTVQQRAVVQYGVCAFTLHKWPDNEPYPVMESRS